jgi:hypothetical protein
MTVTLRQSASVLRQSLCDTGAQIATCDKIPENAQKGASHYSGAILSRDWRTGAMARWRRHGECALMRYSPRQSPPTSGLWTQDIIATRAPTPSASGAAAHLLARILAQALSRAARALCAGGTCAGPVAFGAPHGACAAMRGDSVRMHALTADGRPAKEGQGPKAKAAARRFPRPLEVQSSGTAQKARYSRRKSYPSQGPRRLHLGKILGERTDAMPVIPHSPRIPRAGRRPTPLPPHRLLPAAATGSPSADGLAPPRF